MKKIIQYTLYIATLLSCYAVFAQKRNTSKSTRAKTETKKLADAQSTAEQPRKDSLNKTDAHHKKQGLWFYKHEASLDEAMYFEYGKYVDDKKEGLWTKLDAEERPLAMENYNDGVLNGTSKYYEQGKLVCVGSYRGLNQKYKFDTIMVTNAETFVDTMVIVPSEMGTTKHGMWRYYDNVTGKLVKEEEYQVDNLIYEKDFQYYLTTDSAQINKRNANLPHNKKPIPKTRTNKNNSLLY